MKRYFFFLLFLMVNGMAFGQAPAPEVVDDPSAAVLPDSTAIDFTRFDSREDSLQFVRDSLRELSVEQYQNMTFKVAAETATERLYFDETDWNALYLRAKCHYKMAEREMRYTSDFSEAEDHLERCVADLRKYLLVNITNRSEEWDDAKATMKEARDRQKFIRQQGRAY